MSAALSATQQRVANLRWSADEVQRAQRMRNAGRTCFEIGAALGRTERATEIMFQRAKQPAATAAKKHWSDEERARAIELRREGWTNATIGGEFGRSADAISWLFSEMRKGGTKIASPNKRAAAVAVVQVKRAEKVALPERKCLKCRCMFPSSGNRICEPCTKSNAGMPSWL